MALELRRVASPRLSRWCSCVTGADRDRSVAGQAPPPRRRRHVHQDIAPILQRSCQECHHADGVAPMSLVTYEEVRPWARVDQDADRAAQPARRDAAVLRREEHRHPEIQARSVADRRGDRRRSRSGPTAARRAAIRPTCRKPLDFDDTDKWTIGEPDLMLKSKDVRVPASGPDWWGDVGLVPTGLTEDRYVSAVEVREVNDIPQGGGDQHRRRALRVPPHDVLERPAWASAEPATNCASSWPIHEVGRNADIFPPEAGRLLQANSALSLDRRPYPLERPRDQGASRVRLQVLPEGLQAAIRRSTLRLGNGIDIDVKPNQANQELHAYATLQEHTKIIAFEPHLHAPGVRMCLEAIWGHNIQTLNCVGYDHNWVKQYVYDDDAAPLLPKGTIVHLIGFLDTTPANKNPADPRNWAGGGRRSIANMFIDLGYSVSLTEEQFQAEMAKRRAKMKSRNDLRHRLPAVLGAADADRRRPTAGTRASSEAASRGDRRCARALALVSLAGRLRRADALHVLERAERVAGLRRMDAERRRLLHAVLRLHEHELAAGVRHSRRPRQQHRAGRARSGPADAFLSAAQPVPVHDPRAEGFRHARS